MDKKHKILFGLWILILVLHLIAIILVPGIPKAETVQQTMKDAVLHETNHVRVFGMEVNPGLVSAFCVTGILLAAALLIRIFAVPRFREQPGRLQMLLESLIDFFNGMARTNSPDHPHFISVYIFAAGLYIFVGTCFELFGIQVVSTEGISIALPAPLSDINGSISMGVMSYCVILGGGIIINRLRGAGNALKEFSLPISMSFRLFGALLSGLLVTELVYYTIGLSFVLPVVVGVMFTLLHALIQTYVLTMLTSVFFGEVTEKHHSKGGKSNE
ncbi:MAG: F0F1 ATP synthase subunit A [Firmicutes bacterium]|nr:F0F1 ATP synthase subunit A [Bacillota bacterium]